MRGKDLFEKIQNIDDQMIEEAADHSKCSKHRRINKKTTIILVAAILLLLAACTAYVVVKWDDILFNHFNPSEAVIKQTESGVQEVEAVSECDGYTLSVSQTLGDSQTIYIVLDIKFPDSVDLSSLLQKDSDGAWDITILPESLRFYRGATDYSEVKGMNINEIDDYFHGRNYLGGCSISVGTERVDIENNTISYLISYSIQDGLIDNEDSMLTMLFDNIANDPGGNNTTIATGPFVVCWSPENSGRIYEFDISNETEKLGTVTISGFALNVKLYHSEYQSLSEFTHTVRIVMKNGETMPLSGGGGGSFTTPSGHINYGWKFNEILVLDDVASIQIGDYNFKVN